MTEKAHWKPTLAFKKFRTKTHELSKVYWLQQLGTDCLLDILSKKNPRDYTVKELPSSFEFKMYPAEIGATIGWLPTFMDRNRLYLLVVYTAFLESYLKEITFFHIASQGFLSQPKSSKELIKLSAVGKALGAPILERSTIPAMIKYAESLYELKFGKNADEWIKLYQIRCEVAHSGGVATPELLRQINGMQLSINPKEYEMLGLSWEELRASMKAADEIASTIDAKVSCYSIQTLETEQVMIELNILNKLPKRNELWKFIHEEYGLQVRRKNKLSLERKFY